MENESTDTLEMVWIGGGEREIYFNGKKYKVVEENEWQTRGAKLDRIFTEYKLKEII